MANHMDVIIGQNLRAQRVFAGLSQTEVGHFLEITFQQVQKYERGLNRISSASLWQLSKHFNCTITDFFIGLEHENDIVPVHDSTELHYASRIIKAVSAIRNTAVKDSLVELAQSLATGNI